MRTTVILGRLGGCVEGATCKNTDIQQIQRTSDLLYIGPHVRQVWEDCPNRPEPTVDR